MLILFVCVLMENSASRPISSSHWIWRQVCTNACANLMAVRMDEIGSQIRLRSGYWSRCLAVRLQDPIKYFDLLWTVI